MERETLNVIDDPFAPTAADIAAKAAELAKYDSPAEIAKREAKRKEDFERGVRLGWHDKHGEPIERNEFDDENEDDDE